MKFPGINTLALEDAAVQNMLRNHAPAIFGDPAARITKIQTTGYPVRLEITFTTDPDPLAETPLEAPPMPNVLPAADDDHPF